MRIDDENKPYSEEDYKKAKEIGLDLDRWNDYEEFYELFEKVECE